jgi:two-component system, NarL family, response regulator NreC
VETNQTIRVGLVEDQFLFRKGIKAILESWPDIEVIFETSVGYSIIESLNQSSSLPHVLLVDLSLPPDKNNEVFGGLEVTRAIRMHFPEMKIIILSVHDEDNFISELILNGAHGYLMKDCDPQEVYDAVVAVHRSSQGSYINGRTLAALQKNNGTSEAPRQVQNTVLTKREIEILQLVCKEFTTEEIAEKLFISVKTVNGHRNNLLQKTQSRNAAGLVAYAVKNKIIDLS